MPIDLFEVIRNLKDSVSITDLKDISCECATTMACGEEGNWCGGGPAVAASAIDAPLLP